MKRSENEEENIRFHFLMMSKMLGRNRSHPKRYLHFVNINTTIAGL